MHGVISLRSDEAGWIDIASIGLIQITGILVSLSAVSRSSVVRVSGGMNAINRVQNNHRPDLLFIVHGSRGGNFYRFERTEFLFIGQRNNYSSELHPNSWTQRPQARPHQVSSKTRYPREVRKETELTASVRLTETWVTRVAHMCIHKAENEGDSGKVEDQTRKRDIRRCYANFATGRYKTNDSDRKNSEGRYSDSWLRVRGWRDRDTRWPCIIGDGNRPVGRLWFAGHLRGGGCHSNAYTER